MDFGPRALAHIGRVGFAHIGHEPHGGEIGHREDGRAGAGLHILAQAHLAIDDGAGNGCEHLGLGVDRLATGQGIDLRLGAAQDGQAIAYRRQRGVGGVGGGLGGREVALALLPVLQGTGARVEQRVLALLEGLRLRQLGVSAGYGRLGRQQVAAALDEFTGLHGQQGLALAHDIAKAGLQPGDAPGERREDRRAAVGVERDLAFGDAFGAELGAGDGRNAQAGQLFTGRLEAARLLGGRTGWRRAGAVIGGGHRGPEGERRAAKRGDPARR